ncbi:MAG: UDP-2,3-diacylglucosamine diphosphatase [Planctomycetota bacterium]|nr:UDP-2,3-diacylglucosamine diphosphatase [Planctomycetota bacterium]
MTRTLPRIQDVAPLPMPVAVAGDVHIAADEPHVRDAFIRFVEARAAVGAGTLVLLGDLFDAWWGPQQARDPFLVPVFDALRAADAAGMRLVFQAGNRDFCFEAADGIDIDFWSDVVRTEIGGRRVLLTHGDLLCVHDRGYQLLRRGLRGRQGRPRAWVRALPYGLMRYLAAGAREASKRETRRKPRAYMDIDYATARRWMDHAEVDVLVAGHVHTGVHHELPAADPDGRSRDILVLKDWERGGGVVLFDEQGLRLIAPET